MPLNKVNKNDAYKVNKNDAYKVNKNATLSFRRVVLTEKFHFNFYQKIFLNFKCIEFAL